jgi:RNA polymerase sigma-70 factor (ECF subfamily)
VNREITLLERVAQGEADAVPRLLDRYGPLIWTIVRKQVPPHAAEDVVQEICIQLWKSAGRYDPEVASEATFITTIARRRLIDHRRKLGRRPEAEELFEEAVPEPEEEADPVELADEAQQVAGAIAKLRPEQRRVLELSLVEGMTQVQIAEVTRLPLGTVKSHARRGLERVRAALGVGEVES